MMLTWFVGAVREPPGAAMPRSVPDGNDCGASRGRFTNRDDAAVFHDVTTVKEY